MKIEQGLRFVRCGGVYPRDAYDVMKISGSQVIFAPASGGFVMRVAFATFRANFRAVTEEDMVSRWERATFCLDDGREYEGLTDGSQWNGWECPRFPREVALQILKDAAEWFRWTLDEATGVIRGAFTDGLAEGEEPPEEEWSTFEPETIDGNVCYGVGAAWWCWWRKAEDDEEIDA